MAAQSGESIPLSPVQQEITSYTDARDFVMALGISGNGAEIEDAARRVLVGDIDPELLQKQRETDRKGFERLEGVPSYLFDN